MAKKTCFYQVIAALDSTTASCIKDVITHPPDAAYITLTKNKPNSQLYKLTEKLLLNFMLWENSLNHKIKNQVNFQYNFKLETVKIALSILCLFYQMTA